MPKLFVVVVKDDTGKLWNLVSAEEEIVRHQDSFGTNSLFVHKSEPAEDSPQCVRATESTMEDHVTLGLLPHEACANPRIKEK
jgi:hypothetical protein